MHASRPLPPVDRSLPPVLAAALVLAAAVPGQDESVLVHTGVLRAPAGRVWRDLTSAEALPRLWGVAKAEVDLRIGGAIRTHYGKDGTIGDPDTIVHTIVALVPGRSLTLKTRAPANASPGIAKICEVGHGVFELVPLGPDRTRFTVYGCGYGEGPLFDEARRHFDAGNRWTIARMQKAYPSQDDPADPAEVEELLQRLEGSFAATFEGPGDPFTARAEMRRVLGGFELVKSTAPVAGTPAPTGLVTMFRDPEVEAWALLVREPDGVARGWLRREGDRLELRGTKASNGGESSPFAMDWAVEDGGFTAFRDGHELRFRRSAD